MVIEVVTVGPAYRESSEDHIMSITVDRNHNVIADIFGKSRKTVWVLVGNVLSRGDGWHVGNQHYTYRFPPHITLPGITPRTLTLELFVSVTGWVPDETK